MSKKPDEIASRFTALNSKIGKMLGDVESTEVASNPEEERAEMVATIKASGLAVHLLHLKTRDDKLHRALRPYYEGIDALIDRVVEVYQGRTNSRIEGYPETVSIAIGDPDQYFADLQDCVDRYRGTFGPYSEIHNLIDSISELIGSTRYQLSLK